VKGKKKTRTCHIIDMTKAPYSTFGAGVKKSNPKRCLNCGKPIKRGEAWSASTSAEDPRYGRYTVIQHAPRCPDPKARDLFQRKLVRQVRG